MTEPATNPNGNTSDDGQAAADQVAALRAVKAETEAEVVQLDDGSIVVTLHTDFGHADIRVPPFRRWRSVAKNALYNRDDDLAWAVQTLSADDAQEWIRLNPTGEDAGRFFADWGRATGQTLGEALASRRR